MKKQKNVIRSTVARAMAVVMAVTVVSGSMPSIPARAEGGAYPYMIFAASDGEGAVTFRANNVGLNGSVATNGTIAVIGGNCNINGTRTERAGEAGEPVGMPDLRERIENTYFAAGTEEHAQDYALEEININVNTPIEGNGEVSLSGNINLNAGIMAQEDIVLDGEVKNSGDVALYSASGNIIIDSTNVNLNGLAYAPYGEIRITAMNVNMNNVILIAQKVTVEANGINGGMNQGMAQFIGTEYNVIEGGAGNDNPAKPENPDPEEPEPTDPENPDIDWSVDTDGDGLPDALEEEIGTDPEAADTDGDGLSDYEEAFTTGTDPMNPSSVQTGVSDAAADSDGDGISNREELDKGLSPANTDSDYDGISDYDELYVYGTDPAAADSDGDGIKDGDEISLGLDPLNGSTNGVPDGECIIHQAVGADSEALSAVNTADSPYRLSIEADAAGYVAGNLDAGETPYAYTIENDAILGNAVGLEYQDGNVESVTLKFEIAEPYRENISGQYAQYSETNQGIRRLTVFCWADEVNMMVPVRTQYDMEHHTVYAEVNGFGTYCLMDRELWYEQLGVAPSADVEQRETGMQVYAESSGIFYAAEEQGMICTSSSADGTVSHAMINGETKTVYMHDGHMYAVYAGPATWTEAKAYCENFGGHLATITSQGEQDFIEEYVLTADIAPRYWIGGYSETYPFDFQWVMGEEFDYVNWEDGEPNYSSELYIEIYGNYNGWYGLWNNHPNVCVTKSFICEWEEESVSGNGIRVYNALTWTALPEDFGAVSIHSIQDYDGDSLLDTEEIMFGHELYGEPDENGEYELPTIGEVFDYAACKYGIELPEEWGLGDVALKELFDTKVVLVLSDPAKIDTDGEGIPDNIDIRPLEYDNYADKYIEFINAGYIDMNKMIQTSEGFTICMTPLPEMLLNMGYEEYAFDSLCSSGNNTASNHGMSEVAADWYLYSVEKDEDTVFSLIKLRDVTGYNSMPSVAVPFIELDIDQMQTYSDPDNLALLDEEFDKIIYQNNAQVNHVLSSYFEQPEADALYVIPQIYARLVIQNECINRNTNIIYMTENVASKYAIRTLEEYQVGNSDGNPEIYDDNGTDDKSDDYIMIVDPHNPTLAEQECVLALRSGNPSFDSFAAEIVYHADLVDVIGLRKHTVKADLSVGDQKPDEWEYKADYGYYVKLQIAVSGGGIPEDLILKLDWSTIFE